MNIVEPKAAHSKHVSIPIGTTVQLIKMKDPFSKLKPGLIGTVQSIDARGNIKILWENGATLALIPDTDTFIVINKTSD